jgi:hypothetical protein
MNECKHENYETCEIVGTNEFITICDDCGEEI